MFEIIGLIVVGLLSLWVVAYSLFIFYALLILDALRWSGGSIEIIIATVLIKTFGFTLEYQVEFLEGIVPPCCFNLIETPAG